VGAVRKCCCVVVGASSWCILGASKELAMKGRDGGGEEVEKEVGIKSLEGHGGI
jgi:hypothetical protein